MLSCVAAYVSVCQADKDSMRSLESSPGYEVTFTLINPQPDLLSVTWDVQSAVNSTRTCHCIASISVSIVKIVDLFLLSSRCYAFSALTLLVGHHEEHPTCKN